MSDMKRFLEAVDKAEFAGEKEGQKPGDQWRGSDKKTPGKKLVGEENVFKELDSHLKENAVERKLKAQLSEFKQGVAEGLDKLYPSDRTVIDYMQDNSWLSAERAYFRYIGLQRKKQMSRSAWEEEIQRFIDLYNKYKGQQGVAEGNK